MTKTGLHPDSILCTKCSKGRLAIVNGLLLSTCTNCDALPPVSCVPRYGTYTIERSDHRHIVLYEGFEVWSAPFDKNTEFDISVDAVKKLKELTNGRDRVYKTSYVGSAKTWS